MSRKCDHDWFDHYMMYSMMSSKGGGGNIGCGPILTLISLGLMVFSIQRHLANTPSEPEKKQKSIEIWLYTL